VYPRIERPREEQPEQAAHRRQHARSAPQCQAAEHEESGTRPQRFRRSKRYEPVDQDARSKGSQGTQQWMLQLSAIVTACANFERNTRPVRFRSKLVTNGSIRSGTDETRTT